MVSSSTPLMTLINWERHWLGFQESYWASTCRVSFHSPTLWPTLCNNWYKLPIGFFSDPSGSRAQTIVCSQVEGYPMHLELTAPGWKHSPTICCRLIQAELEQGEIPKHLEYIDDIVAWGNTAEEAFEKWRRIQVLSKAGFTTNQSQGTCTGNPVIGNTMARWASSYPNGCYQ